MNKYLNPFSGRGTPVVGERLIGRSEIVDRLYKRVTVGAHCSIVGLPRMGKTSIAKELMRLLTNASLNLDIGHISLESIRHPTQAYSRILDEINVEHSLSPDCSHDQAFETFIKTMRKRKSSGKNTIIIIDEIDGILRNDFSEPLLLISRLREIANNIDIYGVTFTFLSRRSLDMIQGAVDCSTLAGLCEVIYLKPLDSDSLSVLSKRSPQPVFEESIDQLWNFTGGHPFLAEVVMCEAVELNSTHIDLNCIEEAQHRQAHEFTHQYRLLQQILSQDSMFNIFCELVVGPCLHPIDLHLVSLLKNYGLIVPNKQGNNQFNSMSEHMTQYLTQLTRITPTWDLLGKVEKQLRSIVWERMTDSFGSSWYQTIPSRNANLNKIIEDLTNKKQREQKTFGNAASDFLLDYAYIDDLKVIIFSEWDSFRTIFAGVKAEWEKRFQNIIKVRNPMAHYRSVPEDSILEAETSCKVFLARFRGDTYKL